MQLIVQLGDHRGRQLTLQTFHRLDVTATPAGVQVDVLDQPLCYAHHVVLLGTLRQLIRGPGQQLRSGADNLLDVQPQQPRGRLQAVVRHDTTRDARIS